MYQLLVEPQADYTYKEVLTVGGVALLFTLILTAILKQTGVSPPVSQIVWFELFYLGCFVWHRRKEKRRGRQTSATWLSLLVMLAVTPIGVLLASRWIDGLANWVRTGSF